MKLSCCKNKVIGFNKQRHSQESLEQPQMGYFESALKASKE